MDLAKKAGKFLKAQLRNWLEDLPSKDVILVVQDGDSAETAVRCLAQYLDEAGCKASIMKADKYKKLSGKLVNHQVIIVGHHDLAKKQLNNVNVQDLGFGMFCGTSRLMCVLRASRKALGRGRDEFAEYYDGQMAGFPEFTEDYAIPARFGSREKTRLSQYDLLWILFVRDFLPRFLGREIRTAAGKAGASGGGAGDPADHIESPDRRAERLTGQFLREAPEAACLTGAVLEQLCENQLRYVPLPSATAWKDRPDRGELLLEREGWQIRRTGEAGALEILDPNGTLRAAGTADQLLSPLLSQLHAQARIRRLRAEGRLEYGIVLGGGGAKGAFQLGVWKWLEEHGGTRRFTGLSGASVGAMNALLFARGDYGRAERIWTGIRKEDLLSENPLLQEKLGSLLSGFNSSEAFAPEKLAKTLLSNLPESVGLFSKEKLRAIVRENLSLEALADKLAYVSLSAFTASNLRDVQSLSSFLCSEYAYLDTERDEPLEPIIRRVLGSAALPGVYAPETVEGRLCIDGGVLDNRPVRPLLQAGYRKLLVIHLHPRKPEEALPEPPAGAELRHVWPLEDLGGTLEISAELTQKRIEAGFRAARFYLDGLC